MSRKKPDQIKSEIAKEFTFMKNMLPGKDTIEKQTLFQEFLDSDAFKSNKLLNAYSNTDPNVFNDYLNTPEGNTDKQIVKKLVVISFAKWFVTHQSPVKDPNNLLVTQETAYFLQNLANHSQIERNELLDIILSQSTEKSSSEVSEGGGGAKRTGKKRQPKKHTKKRSKKRTKTRRAKK